MRRITIVGLLALASLAGCASIKSTASNSSRQVIQVPHPAVVLTPEVQPPVASQPIQNSTAVVEHPAAKQMPAAVTDAGTGSEKVAIPSVANPVKLSTSVKRATQPSKPPHVVTVPEKAPALTTPNVLAKASMTLDLKALEQRLRDTRAIGMFTKLSLKNQVDDLLDQFRAFYRGQIKTPLNDLRQRYDILVMKLLTLLQDSDVTLAADIMSSREAIWDILKDPQKFAQI